MGIRVRVEITDDNNDRSDADAIVELVDREVPSQARLRGLLRHAVQALDAYLVGGSEPLAIALKDSIDNEKPSLEATLVETAVNLEDTRSGLEDTQVADNDISGI